MPNDVFFNGVPHSVQTNERTKNAINPRYTFIDIEKHESDPIKDQQIQPESFNAKQAQPNYPTAKDSFTTNEFSSVSKTNITSNSQKLSTDHLSESEMLYESLHKVEDRIQNLREKYPSQNIQHIGRHNIQDAHLNLGGVQRFDDNMQSLHQESFSENRQLIEEKTVSDNFQKLDPTESRRDNIHYKEKKNIHDNLQHVEAANLDREQAALSESIQNEKKPDLNLHSLQVDSQIRTKSALQSSLAEDELTARVRKMKEKIGKVNQSLTDIEEDK